MKSSIICHQSILSIQSLLLKSKLNFNNFKANLYSQQKFKLSKVTVDMQIQTLLILVNTLLNYCKSHSQVLMSTRQNRRSMNVLNDTLRADNSTLRSKQSEIIAHIDTLIRREKQLVKLKEQLIEQSEKSKQLMIKQRMHKQEKCIKLEFQLAQLSQQLASSDLTLRNLHEEYQLCLKDYDHILAEIATIVETNKGIELHLAQEIQKRSTMQAMIFDYQRLERVLEEQRKYFRQLSTNEEKSHAQRMKQFESIRQKLIAQQKDCSHKKFLDRFKIGFLKLKTILNSKFKTHSQTFIRGHNKFDKITSIGISKFKNCLQLANSRYNKEVKGAFTAWHHNVFIKSTLNNIVENSLRLNFQSKTKIVALNKIIEKLNSDNLNLLHLYERTKIVCLTATSIKRKQTHIAFNRWRDRSAYLTRVKYRIETLVQGLTKALKRSSFNKLAQSVHLMKRFEVASHLLNEYEKTKGMAWAMRKWRWQVQNHEIKLISNYVENMKKFHLIQQRVKYEKRKVKALTSLQLSMTKIQLRNYFSRYYQNVKAGKIAQIDANIQTARDVCVEARKQNKAAKAFYKQKYSQLSLNVIFNSISRTVLNDGFQTLKRNYELDIARKHALLTVMLKKQGKTKYYIMNQFRKNVQYYQKKQMHQVLTDLNHKMQAINQKSTAFRESLKQTIEDLGAQSSKKINEVFEYTFNCQQKVFFNWYSRKSIQKKFKEKLAGRLFEIFTSYAEKNVFQTIKSYYKDIKLQTILDERENKFNKDKQVKLVKRAFYGLLDQLKLHKSVFSKFIHVENVMYFYRLECGLISIMKKSHQQTVKDEQKSIDQLNKHLKSKTQTLNGLTNDKNILNDKLRTLFSKFVSFQQISQNNKEKAFLNQQKKKYFGMYRKNVERKKYTNEVLNNLVRLLQYKNYVIFWKSVLMTLYQSQQVVLKDELSKINKKRKTFDQKTTKTKTDIERKLKEQEEINQNKKTQASYYLNKYDAILSYYDLKHKRLEQQKYITEAFKVWKRQTKATKNIYQTLQKFLYRTQMIEPYQLLFQEFRNYDKKYRSQLVCIKLLERKHKRWLADGFSYWRYNMRHGYSDMLRYKVQHIDDHHEEIKNGIFSKADLYANEVIRKKYFLLKSQIFMGFKNEWVRAKQNSKKIIPMLQKIDNHRIFNAMRNWKWLMFYKKTKRSYLQYKKKIYERGLKKDVFNVLKIHRQEIYNFVDLTQNLVINCLHGLKRFALSKIINTASHERNELKYERRRALHTLLTNKMAKEKMIKRTVMWKWQSQLIPRKHYLCNALKSIEKRILKSAFANINEKKYWNEHYIKDIAEKVTTQGYADVNSVTNILVKEGFDPDELKDYLKKKNERDDKITAKFVGHLKTWPKKSNVVKAFHSWKEYVMLRKNIKRALSKVFNFSQGLGRYFNKWRKKDPVFNQVLQRESRANMLERYKDLERLMKEYRRDMKDSLQNCQQLKNINDQYAKSTKMTVQMALSNIANSVHKGMKQGLQIWRIKAKSYRVIETNKRYDEIVDGIEMLDDQKRKVKQKIKMLESENLQLKQKCKWGKECGDLLKKLMEEKDGLTIDLAEKQHNFKILLEDNLRLKQKIKVAKDSALKLINKIREDQGIEN